MRTLILAFVVSAGLWADVITVPVTYLYQLSATYFPGFAVSDEFTAPAFDPTLGHLNSVTANWQVQMTLFEQFLVDADEGAVVPVDYSQTATVTFAGIESAPVSQSGSVSNATSYTGLGNTYDPFNLAGQTAIDFTNINDFGFYNGVAYFGAGVIVNGIGEDPPDGPEVIMTDTFVSNPGYEFYSTAFISATLSYDFTPIPEPQNYSILGVALAGGIARKTRPTHF
jgi:hypothetical protein